MDGKNGDAKIENSEYAQRLVPNGARIFPYFNGKRPARDNVRLSREPQLSRSKFRDIAVLP
jgi:hypothetical protein